jgi:hypothetical protein
MLHSHDRVEVSTKAKPARRSTWSGIGEKAGPDTRHELVKLQASLGNARVSRMLAQREELPEDEIMAKHDTDIASSGPEVGLEGGPISDELSNRINAKRGGGSTLDSGTRARMESAFGSSFADVRIHADSESDSLNRSVSARAFTTGSDIFFSRNANPTDTSLLAHELTHVVQQRGASSSGPLTVGPAGDSHETAADAAAGSIASGTAIGSAQRELDPALQAIAREAVPEEDELLQ